MQKAGLMRAPLPLRQINTICTFLLLLLLLMSFPLVCVSYVVAEGKSSFLFSTPCPCENLCSRPLNLCWARVWVKNGLGKKNHTRNTRSSEWGGASVLSLYTLSLPCLPPSLPLLSLCPPHLCRWCLMKIRWDQKQIPSKGAGYVMHIMCERRYSVMSEWQNKIKVHS